MGYLLDKQSLDRLDRVLPRVERAPFGDPSGRWTRGQETLWYPCKNVSAQVIPAHGVCRQVTSILDGDHFILGVNAMGTTVDRETWVTWGQDIQPGEYGMCTQFAVQLLACYDEADGTPAMNETWGPAPSSFKLRKHRPGYRILRPYTDRKLAYCVYDPPTVLLGKLDYFPVRTEGATATIYYGPAGSEVSSGQTVTCRNYTAFEWYVPSGGSPAINAGWCNLLWCKNEWWVVPTDSYFTTAKATSNWKIAGGTSTYVTATLWDGAANGFYGPSVNVYLQVGTYSANVAAPNQLANDVLTVMYTRTGGLGNFQWIALDPILDAPIGTVRMMTNSTLPRGWGLMDGTSNSVANGGSGFTMTNLFPRAASSPGGTGGADSHTHTATCGGPSAAVLTTTGAAPSVATGDHTHTITVASSSNVPAYRALRFIERLDNHSS